jgi:hypothetical protein
MTVANIYGVTGNLYELVMRTAQFTLSTQLTKADEQILRALRGRGVGRTLSAALEAAMASYLARPEVAVSVPVPSRQGEEFTKRNYRLSEGTLQRLDEAAATHGYDKRDVVRAAIRWFAGQPANQGPPQTRR